MKVRNLKANHSKTVRFTDEDLAVLASMKVRNQKANHNQLRYRWLAKGAVLASVKVRNLKANHNTWSLKTKRGGSVKVRNLKANHNRDLFTTAHLVVMVIGCCSAHR